MQDRLPGSRAVPALPYDGAIAMQQRHSRKVNTAQQVDADAAITSRGACSSGPRTRGIPEVWHFATIPRRHIYTPGRNAVLSCRTPQERKVRIDRVDVGANLRAKKCDRSATFAPKVHSVVQVAVESESTKECNKTQTKARQTMCHQQGTCDGRSRICSYARLLVSVFGRGKTHPFSAWNPSGTSPDCDSATTSSCWRHTK